MTASAIWYVNDVLPEIRSLALKEPGPDEVLVEALASGVSRGTESLVFQGLIPETDYDRMRAPHQEGDFPYPVKYGYSMIGTVLQGPADLMGKRVFCLYPHQTRFVIHRDKLTPIDDAIPTARAVLTANMETALNAVWDGFAAPGDKIAVIGAGVVGCLTAYLASRIPGTSVSLIDLNPGRRTIAQSLDIKFCTPDQIGSDFDLIFHASASQSGLQMAIDKAGFEARIIEMSWYGTRPISIGLGAAFHSKRLQIIGSQVGTIPPSRRSRWSFDRRLSTALSLLKDPRLDSLLDEACHFEQASERLSKWLAPGGQGLCHRIIYS